MDAVMPGPEKLTLRRFLGGVQNSAYHRLRQSRFIAETLSGQGRREKRRPMEKRWETAPPLSATNSDLKRRIAKDLLCPEVIAELLIRKNLTDPDEINRFFEPSLKHSHDPFLFEDMGKAVERILHAISHREKITIHGDYDVDGTTATALLYLGLRALGAEINYYIPHRMIDGYGVSFKGVNQFRDEGTNLIISVDCGINAIEEVDVINDLGMDIIITDHHNPKDVIPKAHAILNAKMENSKYPFKDLAGVGVAYKLLMAIYIKLNLDTDENVYKYLDLVAVGTIADIVPLVDENRVFAGIGMKYLLQRKNLGLWSLIKICGLSNRELNTTDIVFGLAPRINAAGRMGSALEAVELLVSEDPIRAEELAMIIEEENKDRQKIDQETFREACEMIERKYNVSNDRIDNDTGCLVISSDNWHPGVIGIVASKLVEKYYRPTIMIALTDGVGSGSGRSISDIDLFEALTHVEDVLESFGGHKYAAGLQILVEYLPEFEKRLNSYIRLKITEEQMVPPLKVDQRLELFHINPTLVNWMERFAPFGPGNMRPVFHTHEVTVKSHYIVGRNTPLKDSGNHLKLIVVKDNLTLDLIGFNMGEWHDMLTNFKNERHRSPVVNIAYSLEVIKWQDRATNQIKPTIQGKLKDIHFVI
jgi:single-stranded-DNA-specific exonuclease